MNLTDHFTLEEMVRSETAPRLGIDNIPTAEIIDRLRVTAQLLERIRAFARAHYNPNSIVVVTSGYRCPDLNKAIGGVPTSAHCFGCAADIHVPGVPILTLAKDVAANIMGYDQIIHEFGSWVHVGLARPDTVPRHETLTIGGHPAQTRIGLVPLPFED
jgi:zinc D-Ala-D-Ala carboxypeptidase